MDRKHSFSCSCKQLNPHKSMGYSVHSFTGWTCCFWTHCFITAVLTCPHRAVSRQRKHSQGVGITGTRHQFTCRRRRPSEAGATWLLLYKLWDPQCTLATRQLLERRHTGEGAVTVHECVRVHFITVEINDVSLHYLQFPQSRVGGDGWDHGSHGSDQSVLQPCGPESSTNRSWTR